MLGARQQFMFSRSLVRWVGKRVGLTDYRGPQRPTDTPDDDLGGRLCAAYHRDCVREVDNILRDIYCPYFISVPGPWS